jgi:putative CocE/NonD family hydrolase
MRGDRSVHSPLAPAPRRWRLASSLLAASVCCAAAAPSADYQAPEPRWQVHFEQSVVPMPDGVSLSADLYLPAGGEGDRFPVLLEYLPYRKNESRRYRWHIYEYFVRRGFAVARVDIRGTGASEGRLPEYEYSEVEQDDAEQVIAWLAAQPWSSGRVGMFGISWGGFNSIHLGMRAPPALGAILAIAASDDLFHDDVHYVDGLMHLDAYEIHQDLANAVVATPSLDVAEARLVERFDTSPWVIAKLEHAADGPFWRRASLAPDYSRLQVPALLIGGWYDGYRDSVARMLERAEVPVKALLGPWPHALPHDAVPGPNVEWRQMAVRWFDHFLNGRETGVLDEPALTAWIRSGHPPGRDLQVAPGRWWHGAQWPPADQPTTTLFLDALELRPSPPAEPAERALRYVPTAGFEAGTWWGDALPDQRPIDAMSLVWESEPLREPITVLGFARARLNVKVDAPIANWFVRLGDAAPDGAVTLVTGAGASAAQNVEGAPRALEPGEELGLAVEMHLTSWTFQPGHRIRLSVSNALWPLAWPTPHPMTARVRLGGPAPSRLDLPLAPASLPGEPPPGEVQPQAGPPPWPPEHGEREGAWPAAWSSTLDVLSGERTISWRGRTSTRYEWGERRQESEIRWVANDERPSRARVEADTSIEMLSAGESLVWRGELELWSDESEMHYRYRRTLSRDGRTLRERRWSRDLPRALH